MYVCWFVALFPFLVGHFILSYFCVIFSRKWNPRENIKIAQKHGVYGVCGHFGFVSVQLLDSVSDAMAFGALEPCPECSGQLVSRFYRCFSLLLFSWVIRRVMVRTGEK